MLCFALSRRGRVDMAWHGRGLRRRCRERMLDVPGGRLWLLQHQCTTSVMSEKSKKNCGSRLSALILLVLYIWRVEWLQTPERRLVGAGRPPGQNLLPSPSRTQAARLNLQGQTSEERKGHEDKTDDCSDAVALVWLKGL